MLIMPSVTQLDEKKLLKAIGVHAYKDYAKKVNLSIERRLEKYIQKTLFSKRLEERITKETASIKTYVYRKVEARVEAILDDCLKEVIKGKFLNSYTFHNQHTKKFIAKATKK